MIRKVAAITLFSILMLAASATSAKAPTTIKPLDTAFQYVEVPTVKPSIEIIIDPDRRNLETKPPIVVPLPQVVVKPKTSPQKISTTGFILDPNVSWYGPGFYGKRTGCGLAYTKTIMGVANKTLPCGTLVTFMWKGKYATVPVIDRGPYVAGRQWDLSGALCTYLNHCHTGPIYYRVASH